jgi:hypothetical protein
VRLCNFGPLADGQDWLLNRCKTLQKRKIPVCLEFQDGEYMPLIHEERLQMGVEMAFSYYMSSLDPRDFPEWMDTMDKEWHNYCTDDEDCDDESSDTEPEDYFDNWDLDRRVY